jgi:hypothetical protein
VVFQATKIFRQRRVVKRLEIRDYGPHWRVPVLVVPKYFFPRDVAKTNSKICTFYDSKRGPIELRTLYDDCRWYQVVSVDITLKKQQNVQLV